MAVVWEQGFSGDGLFQALREHFIPYLDTLKGEEYGENIQHGTGRPHAQP